MGQITPTTTSEKLGNEIIGLSNQAELLNLSDAIKTPPDGLYLICTFYLDLLIRLFLSVRK